MKICGVDQIVQQVFGLHRSDLVEFKSFQSSIRARGLGSIIQLSQGEWRRDPPYETQGAATGSSGAAQLVALCDLECRIAGCPPISHDHLRWPGTGGREPAEVTVSGNSRWIASVIAATN
jgi:hypothetical protein